MEGYKLTVENKFIIRLSDGAYIPINEESKQYQEYKSWLAEGNTPDQAQTAEEFKKSKLISLDAEYDPQFDSLTLAWATASMDGDAATAAARLANKQTLKQEYQQKREAIING